jgi:hypothetical protein
MPTITPVPRLRAVSLLVLALASGCAGPDIREASVAILLMMGPIVLLTHALAWPLSRLWRSVRPELDFRWRPFVVVGLALSLLGVFTMVVLDVGISAELLVLALWIVGASYLTLFLLIWRLRLSSTKGLVRAHAIASTVMFLPALLVALVGPDDRAVEPLFYLVVLPGFGGFVSGLLYAIFLVEALSRWHLARKVDAAVASLDR